MVGRYGLPEVGRYGLARYDDTDPEWLRVRGYRSLNSAKTQFAPRENDLFTVDIDNIIGKLADPKLLPRRAIAYEFIGTVDTKEM